MRSSFQVDDSNLDEGSVALHCYNVMAESSSKSINSTECKNQTVELPCSPKIQERIGTLTQVVRSLEHSTLYPPNFPFPSDAEHEQVLRARRAVISHKMYSAVFKWVPVHYYSLPLIDRAQILGAHSTHQLCKSMLMENKAYDSSIYSSEERVKFKYSQFYLVVLQYDAVISAKKLQSQLRALAHIGKRLDPCKFEFRVASEHDNEKRTGFTHNAVTPFGMLEPVPIILAKSIVDDQQLTQFIWMGGGHVQLKLGVSMKELISGINAVVLDVTLPRIGRLGVGKYEVEEDF